MLPELEDYYQRLSGLHDGLKQAIAGLSAEALDWVPGPDMNSLRVLMVHTAGAERYWIGDMAGQQPSGRDRDAEFRARGLDEAGAVVPRSAVDLEPYVGAEHSGHPCRTAARESIGDETRHGAARVEIRPNRRVLEQVH